MPISIRKLLGEPLMHFALLGGAIFAVDAAFAPAPETERPIEVTPAVRQGLVERFQLAERRAPDVAELDDMVEGWITEEALYRRGRALGLDRGDEIVRDRIVQRMYAVLANVAVAPPPDDATLRRWFDAHRERFDAPARFDFTVKRIPGGEAAARALAERLGQALATGEGPFEPEPPLTSFAKRPRPNVVALYGAGFAGALENQPPFEWRAVETPMGWHIMRLDGLEPAEPASFDSVREMALEDWRRAARAAALDEELGKIRSGFGIVRAAPEPDDGTRG